MTQITDLVRLAVYRVRVGREKACAFFGQRWMAVGKVLMHEKATHGLALTSFQQWREAISLCKEKAL